MQKYATPHYARCCLHSVATDPSECSAAYSPSGVASIEAAASDVHVTCDYPNIAVWMCW
jgi:hypothetical protein